MECDSPIYVRHKDPKPDGKGGWQYTWPAGCGKCMACLQKRKRQWSFRLYEELRCSFSAYFVTLTYNDKFVPYDDNGFCANKNDHKHFIKWLKYYEQEETELISTEEFKRIGKQSKEETGQLKYYATIEYGDSRDRPHWHYILFNVRDINNMYLAWATQVRLEKGVYEPGESYGKIDIQECNINAIDYVLKYMMKNDAKEKNQNRQQEVSFQSKGLGIGAATEEFRKYIARPDGNTLLNSRGGKIGVPRYYRKKFLTEEQLQAKQAYVQRCVESDKQKKEEQLSLQGIEPTNYARQGAENRYKNLKNRRRREFD